MNLRLNTTWSALVLLVITLIAYANSFHAPFQFDDFHQIANNEHIRSLSDVPGFFTSAGEGSQFAGRRVFRPLLLASFAVNYALSGNAVWGYHAVNLALHFLSALMVFFIVRRVAADNGGGQGSVVPRLSALVFAAHPVQTGAVTYISGRSVVAASLFVLLGLYCYIRYREDEGRSWLWLAGSVLSFLLGLLTKEAAVCLLGLLPAYDLLVRRQAGRTAKATLLAYLPFLAVFALYFFVRGSVLGFLGVDEAAPSRAAYLASMPKVYWLYIRLMLLPINQNADYSLPMTQHLDVATGLLTLALAALAYWLIRLRKFSPSASFFGLWFFIALVPESSVFPILDIAVEYRLYLASAGLIACVLSLPWPACLPRWTGKGMAFAVLACLMLLTINRNTVWTSTYSLWSDVAAKSPSSARAHINLGNSLQEAGRDEEAIREFRQAVTLNATPHQRAEVHNNIGLGYMKLGRMDEALGEYEAAIKEDPGIDALYVNASQVLLASGRYGEALGMLLKAEDLNPGRSSTLYMLAWAYQKTGRMGESLSAMQRAFDAAPGEFAISLDLARFYMFSGMADKALLQARVTEALARDEAQARQVEELKERLGRR